jgi:uncharacterized secreted protein with C-terminal beta-propeller domain
MANRQKPLLIYFLATATILLLIFVSLSTVYRPRPVDASTTGRFKDLKELQDFVDSNTKLASLLAPVVVVNGGPGLGPIGITGQSAAPLAATSTAPSAVESSAANSVASGAQTSPDYSSTNNQVAGVDEADIVKSDGSYLYVRSGSKIDILAAYPPEQAKLLSSLTFDNPPTGLFVDGNRMLVIGQQEPLIRPLVYNTPNIAAPGIFHAFPVSPPFQPQGVSVAVYDTSDKASPKLLDSFSITGASYVASRMIDGYVYLIANTPLDLGQSQATGPDSPKLPEIIEGNGSVTTLPASAIQYFELSYPSYQYTMVEAYNLGAATRKTGVFLTGAAQQVFASAQNIYLASPAPVDPLPLLQKYLDQLTPLLPDSLTNQLADQSASPEQKLQQLSEVLSMGAGTGPGNQAAIAQIISEMQQDLALAEDQTLVQKIQISSYEATYQDQADVPGQVLNQYSMDEQDGYFRIATTTRDPEQSAGSNNIFVYGPELQLVGQLTGLAPGEHIYSARFLGQRAYLVTFQQVDPFFVVDLSDPTSPKVLGDLKIPGFSDYLQPYDENHIIGIGKDTTPNPQENGMARPTGLKIALFDVTNPQQPKELSRYVLPDGSDSQALYDPRALLFSLSKNLLALPVSSPNNYGQYYSYWQGAYVFNISLDQGIVLKGTIEHPVSNPSPASSQIMVDGSGGGGGGGMISAAPNTLPINGPLLPVPEPYQQYGNVQRILYIGDVLYTISDSLVKLNDIDSLAELKALNL